jgi:hypothetical protein
MPTNLMRPPYIVDAGPFPGVYLSHKAYQNHCRAQGVDLHAYFERFAKNPPVYAKEDPWQDAGGEG